MKTKHIECTTAWLYNDNAGKWEHDARWKIKRLNNMLNNFFLNDDLNQEYIDFGIHFGVGTETEEITFLPYTWDVFTDTAKRFICNIIVEEDLEKYPFYANMLEQYSKDLGEEWFTN